MKNKTPLKNLRGNKIFISRKTDEQWHHIVKAHTAWGMTKVYGKCGKVVKKISGQREGGPSVPKLWNFDFIRKLLRVIKW